MRYRIFPRLGFSLGLVFAFGTALILAAQATQAAVSESPVGTRIFVDIAKSQKPTVVNVSTTQVVKPRLPFQSPFGEDPFEDFWEFFRRRFRGAPERPFQRQSLGSGFIIDKEGYILTNNHVIENATEIKVKLADEREFEAKVVGKDSKTDIALIKVDAPEELPVAKLGDSDELEVGDWVMAIGNPFGLSHTVTVGVVSAKGRVIGSGPYDDFIQTDASINPGNSGGPLLNVRGEVVGINTAIFSRSRTPGNIGIGFATPINIAKEILIDLKTKGSVNRGRIGVTIQRITPALAEALKLKDTKGALVTNVVKGGPADKAGVKREDVIIEFDGKPIESASELPRVVAVHKPGSTATVKVIREGKTLTLTVTLDKLTEMARAEEMEEALGMEVEELSPELAGRFGIDVKEGIVVTEVQEGSPAHEGGIRQGDVIQEVNKKPVKNLQEFQDALEEAKADESILFVVRRRGGTFFAAVKNK